MDQPDLPLPADTAGTGSCVSHYSSVQSQPLSAIISKPHGCGADGFHQLHHALGHLHALLLWLWTELLWRIAVLPDLLCRVRDLDSATHCQPDLATILPVRTTGMVVAQLNVLEGATLPEAVCSIVRTEERIG